MSLIRSSGATATVAEGSSTVSITGLDVAQIVTGMTLHLGSDTVVSPTGYVVASAVGGPGGGTVELLSPVAEAASAVPFIVDTRAYTGPHLNLAGIQWQTLQRKMFGSGV